MSFNDYAEAAAREKKELSAIRERLMQADQFRAYVGLLNDPSEFLKTLDWAFEWHKVSQLRRAFPSYLTNDQFISSLLLNLQQDYGSMITDLPHDFYSEETKGFTVHVGNTNQLGIHYTGEIIKGENPGDLRIACVSFHFRDINGSQSMHLENVQGELKEGGRHSRREVRRVYGKLNSHFGEDWRLGVLRQPVQYARSRAMEVKGVVPGLFAFLGSSLPEYPTYALNYIRTYLGLGIPLENIELRAVPDWAEIKLDSTLNFLQTRSHADRLQLLASAVGEYTKTYDQLSQKCFWERTISIKTYEEQCKSEFARVATKYLSEPLQAS